MTDACAVLQSGIDNAANLFYLDSSKPSAEGQNMTVRRFTGADAAPTSAMIARSLRDSCVRDYGETAIEALIGRLQPDDLLERAAHTHFYVAEDGGAIVGCGSVGPYWDSTTEACLFNIFVDPAMQRRGVGRAIVGTLEKDEYAAHALCIHVHASVTGLPFYAALGYSFEGSDRPDREGLYLLKKCL